MVALTVVRGAVARDADLVEEIKGLGGDGRLGAQATQQVGLALSRPLGEPAAGGRLACEQLALLAQFDEAGDGIIRKIALGQRAEAVELGLVGAQEGEIQRCKGRGYVSCIPFRLRQCRLRVG